MPDKQASTKCVEEMGPKKGVPQNNSRQKNDWIVLIVDNALTFWRSVKTQTTLGIWRILVWEMLPTHHFKRRPKISATVGFESTHEQYTRNSAKYVHLAGWRRYIQWDCYSKYAPSHFPLLETRKPWSSEWLKRTHSRAIGIWNHEYRPGHRFV